MADDLELPDDFVTITDAARRLGLPERTAARYVAKLPESDRQPSANGRHRLVRLSALAALLPDHDDVAVTGSQLADNDRQMADKAAVEAAAATAALMAEKDARIEQLSALLDREQAAREADNERWSKAHDQAQQLQLSDRAEIGELRRRLEEANRAFIEAPTVRDSGSHTSDIGGQVADTAVVSRDTHEGVRMVEIPQDTPASGEDYSARNNASATGAGGNAGEAPRRGFWARLMGKG